MKRKQISDDTPTAAALVTATAVEDAETTFASLGLDARLLQGVATLGFANPTLVQAKAIPLALEGKDILARAKTGSGKTAAYLLPILHSILKTKEESPNEKATRAFILVPTKELAEQVLKMTEKLAQFCGKAVRAVNIAQNVSEQVQRSLLAENPDIVISTPSRALLHINLSGQALVANVSQMVIDEADLVLSYGYDDDLQAIAKALPKGLQTFLMSATLTKEVETLKSLFCRSPVILRLHEDEEDVEGEGVSQYVVKCAEDEKFLLIYVIFKLKLIKGKCIVFVGEIDRCYRLKLFLEQFGIRSCVLNSELPVNSRLHIVEEFNKGVYDIIIATDENEVVGDEEDELPEKKKKKNSTPADVEMPDADADAEAAVAEATTQKKKKRKKPRLDKEYGVSRGIDFQNVACVLNFDLPTSAKSYTHRIGRTARAGKTGMAMTFVVPEKLHGKHKPTTIPTTANDEKLLAKITAQQAKKGKQVKPYIFDMEQVQSFRYRMDDALRAVTRTAIREARTRELRQELLASEKLKRHFEENPEDLKHLRHDGELRAARIQPHLKHVPEYLLPKDGTAALTSGPDISGVGLKKSGENRIRKARERNKRVRKNAATRGKGRDPLKMFKGGKGKK
ncbi:ATP-dependent RNA helicase dbp9 [Tricharina praecox]|uniref:ATP-dependent RNA helicase dbp9 n=1 Tax=Tricharina praecox TaxID=43433 RepID=UPI00221F18C5|nr:ATP-dependent RNA helicase dbp9 [Tricharina praecox]KAI5843219.1 ATP-dependent RNA helicase dbp9 [Tricharina praecox]